MVLESWSSNTMKIFHHYEALDQMRGWPGYVSYQVNYEASQEGGYTERRTGEVGQH